MKKYLFMFIAAVLIAGGIFIYKNFFAKQDTKVIETAKAGISDIRGVIVESGIIKLQVGAVVKVGARATGTIVTMAVKIGDRVRRNQLIALIDDREILRAIEQQQAALAAAENTLKQVELTYPLRIAEAKANYEYAKLSYEREKELVKREYTARDSVERAQSQFDASEALFKRLQDEYRTQRSIAQSNIEDHAAQLKQQETRLTYTRIHAPIDGVVSDVTAQEGETIVAGLQVANLVTVQDPTSLEMWIYVDETDIGRVQKGQKVEYYVDTFPAKLFFGAIEKIYPQPVVKDNIVYYLSTLTVSKEDAAFLRPEMTTHVKIIYAEKKHILTIPNAAIKFEKGKQIVYKVTGPHQVQKVDVTIGVRGEEKTEILSGVTEGEELATKLILPIPPKP